MIGKTKYLAIGPDRYEPHPSGRWAYVIAARGLYANTPESHCPRRICRHGYLTDLVLWHPRCLDRWRLRTGAAEWLGAIEPQYCEPDPVAIWRSPLRWLQADCEGLVLLTSGRAEYYRVLSNCRGGLVAEDEVHKAELRRILERPWPAPNVMVRPAPLKGAAP